MEEGGSNRFIEERVWGHWSTEYICYCLGRRSNQPSAKVVMGISPLELSRSGGKSFHGISVYGVIIRKYVNHECNVISSELS